jgi:hypothetical protein
MEGLHRHHDAWMRHKQRWLISYPLRDAREGEVPFVNGSILRVVIKGFFPFEEMEGLEPVADPRTKS